MKASIEVTDRKEADAIRTALMDPAVRAFVVIMGTLAALESDGERLSCYQMVGERLGMGKKA